MDDGVRHSGLTNDPLWKKRKEGPSPETVRYDDDENYVSPFKHGGPGCERCFGIPGDQLERLKRLYEVPEPRLTRKERPLWAMLREEYPGGVSHVVLATKLHHSDSALRMAIRRLRDKLPRGVTIDNDYGSYRIVVHVQ